MVDVLSRSLSHIDNTRTVIPLQANSDSEEEGEVLNDVTHYTSAPKLPGYLPPPTQNPLSSPATTTTVHHPTHPPAAEDVSMEDRSAPFVMPSEDEFKALPVIGRDESPYKNSPAVTAEGPNDLLSATLFQANTGDYAAPIIPYHVATANLSKAVHAQIDKNPSVYLILVMFLGGTYFFRCFTNVAEEIQKTLAGIAGPTVSVSPSLPPTLWSRTVINTRVPLQCREKARAFRAVLTPASPLQPLPPQHYAASPTLPPFPVPQRPVQFNPRTLLAPSAPTLQNFRPRLPRRYSRPFALLLGDPRSAFLRPVPTTNASNRWARRVCLRAYRHQRLINAVGSA
ncbi:hypothetical protein B0H13DRAFT_2350197 [Mycena leptocephala]|nr:hypothetical protein B0H13DRAFT_2350197 [Mycena leptocephala]